MDSPAPKKARSGFFIRNDLLNENTINSMKCAWTGLTGFASNGVDVFTLPFPLCMVHSVVSNQDLLKQAVTELKDVKFYNKSNDLYQFTQSDDVKNLTSGTFIPQLYAFVKNDLRIWVDKIIGENKLKEDISATFSSYSYQDRLLCHDDKCEDRHIAFILYLTEDWEYSDGGCLQLFNTDNNGYPSEVQMTLKPIFNSLVFFEVTQNSFHQVSEILSPTKQRLSLNGWFHRPTKNTKEIKCPILELPKRAGNDEEFALEDYFLSTYLNDVNKLDIKAIFAAESEIQLDEFLLQKLWEEIRAELRSDKLRWDPKGPANMRRYEVAHPTTLPPPIETLRRIFESKCWFRYLTSITGLDLAPSKSSDLEIWEKGEQPHCNLEFQRWTNSCYTLIHDQDPEFHSEALDVVLRFPYESGEGNGGEEEQEGEEHKGVPQAGHIVYMDAESRDEECLLHIGNKMNSLGMVFRDNKTVRFTKYLHQSARPFYQILCTYREWRPPEDEPSLKHCKEEEEEEEDDDDDDEDPSLSAEDS